jgi:hypothetical protein
MTLDMAHAVATLTNRLLHDFDEHVADLTCGRTGAELNAEFRAGIIEGLERASSLVRGEREGALCVMVLADVPDSSGGCAASVRAAWSSAGRAATPPVDREAS